MGIRDYNETDAGKPPTSKKSREWEVWGWIAFTAFAMVAMGHLAFGHYDTFWIILFAFSCEWVTRAKV